MTERFRTETAKAIREVDLEREAALRITADGLLHSLRRCNQEVRVLTRRVEELEEEKANE
jgi:hypothetical protein